MKKYNKKFTPKTTNQIATEVTEKILDCLKEGTIPWKSGIIGEGASMVSYDDKQYRGVNQWILLATMIKNKFKSNKWITYNRCRKEGGHVLKGQKSTSVVFWNFTYKADPECTQCDRKNTKLKVCDCQVCIPFLKTFALFNMEQTSLFDESLHVPKPVEVEDVDVNVGMAHQLVSDWDSVVPIKYGHNNFASPYYAPIGDYINIPFGDGVAWVNEEVQHKTTFHEMIHSTGHKSRLDRFDEAVMDGIDAGKLHSRGEYSAEELVAEMGSQMLADLCNFQQEHIDDTSAYIASWIKCLEENPKWVIWASGRAVKAVDMILDNSEKGVK